MRDPNRIEKVLSDIAQIWHTRPDLRLGQLIGNVLEGTNLYYVEDDGLVNALKDSYDGKTEPVNFDEDAYILDLIKKYPYELCFVLQLKDYKQYLASYIDAGGDESYADLQEHEFNALKNYFNKENK